MRIVLISLLLALSCGTAAQSSGVGNECGDDDDCADDQACLPFAGGYCGIADCDSDDACPDGSACVTAEDGSNYCFLLCNDKPECNVNRTVENESNCVSNITYVEAVNEGIKACVPPSGV
jgi:hypothetical protein